jgi:hypothetical protein
MLLVSQVLTHTPKVFSNPKWASLGFLIAHPSLDEDARTKLKIKDRPEPSALVTVLGMTPPKDETTARQWFGALAGHIAGSRFRRSSIMQELNPAYGQISRILSYRSCRRCLLCPQGIHLA